MLSTVENETLQAARCVGDAWSAAWRSAFAGFHFQPQCFVLAVRCLRYGLSTTI